MTSEKYIEARGCQIAKRNGWSIYKFTSPNNRGVPDRIAFRSGDVLLIEFKAPGRKPTALQEHVHTRFLEIGFPVHVVDSVAGSERLFGNE